MVCRRHHEAWEYADRDGRRGGLRGKCAIRVFYPVLDVDVAGMHAGKDPEKFVELKTSMQKRGPHDEARFERYVQEVCTFESVLI